MRVLVTGAGGFLGRRVVERLLDRGHAVRALVRPSSEAPPWTRQVEVFRADLRAENDLASAFDGLHAVIHLAAAVRGDDDTLFADGVVATERFLAAMARSETKRLVFASSIVVYDWHRARGTMDEDTALETQVYLRGGYDVAKVWQERVVSRMAKARGWELTVMRPGFIWGAGQAAIGGMGRQAGPFYVLIGPATRLPLTHVDNCADCFVEATENPAAIGQVFNVVDDDRIRVWRYALEHARGTARCAVPIPVPYHLGLGTAHLAAAVSRLFFGRKGRLPGILTPRRFEAQFKPLRFSNRRLREILRWSPPHGFAECLARTYKAE